MLSFHELVGLAYDAPFSPGGWNEFLRELGALTRSRAAAIKWLAFDGRFHIVAEGFGEAALRGYQERYAAMDAWSSVPLESGADVFGDELLPRRALERTEFFQDFCRHHELLDIHKIMLAKTRESQVSVALMKCGARIDRARERDLTRELAPHLRRAVAIGTRVAHADDVRGALADVLDLYANAAFLLDARGHVRHVTPGAESIARANDGLRVSRGSLRATMAADDAMLSAYLRTKLDGPVIRVRRPSGKSPYRVVAAPRTSRFDSTIATVVIVSEERVPTAIDLESRLRRGYLLTPAEARVAVGVGRGVAPKLVASELGVSWYTVRAQLRQVFAKTGVARQAQLVALVAALERDESRGR